LVKISVIIRPLRNSEKYVDSTTGFIQTTAVQYFMDDTLLINDEIRSAGVTLERHGIPIHMECFIASPSSRVAYRTTLTGRDFGWTQRSDKQLIRYTGLESGSYIFKIQSKTPSHDHPWVESSLRIIIPPPWWEQWWFYALLIGATVALVSLVYRRELFRARTEHLLQQTFTQQQMESQESERKRLASELHDGLGQDLLVVNTELRQLLADRPERSEDLQRITGLVQESIDSVREISSNLHPHHIDRLGVCAAVEALIEKISRSSSLRIESSCDPVDGAMTKEAKLHVYRIIQESLANAVKHSHATAVHVAIRKDGRGIAVSIRDDGKGFDGSITPLSGDGTRNDHARGFGFASMAERARIIGATFSVDSVPERGTTVHLIIPDGKG
jgi:signal transduction histidine kinase